MCGNLQLGPTPYNLISAYSQLIELLGEHAELSGYGGGQLIAKKPPAHSKGQVRGLNITCSVCQREVYSRSNFSKGNPYTLTPENTATVTATSVGPLPPSQAMLPFATILRQYILTLHTDTDFGSNA